jgi:hypothetical protein
MAKNIIILGAGASKQYGAPVMAEFLDVARDLWLRGRVTHPSSFERVFKAIGSLQTVHSKAEFDLVNLESVLSAFEMGKIFGALPGVAPSEIDSLIVDFKRVLVETLEQTLPTDAIPNEVLRASFWRSFTDAIEKTGRTTSKEGKTRSQTAILTFNYDLLLDSVFHANDVPVDYGFTQSEPESVTLLKLHGSLNWFSIPQSKSVKAVFIRNSKMTGVVENLQDIKRVNHAVKRTAVEDFALPGDSKDVVPFIVPPTWNKMDSYHAISQVWSRAATELSEANSIYVVGYSLPPTDSYFRLLYALGSVGENPLKRFYVYNKNQEHAEAFRSLLGPGARDRFLAIEADARIAFQKIIENLKMDGQ